MNTQEKEQVMNIRREHLGRYLHELQRYYRDMSIHLIKQNGFPQLTAGMLDMLSQIDLDGGTEMKEITRRTRLTKQAVSKMIKTCQDADFIETITSNEDGRAVRIIFSETGQALMLYASKCIKEMESHFENIIGKDDFMNLKRIVDKAATKLKLIDVDFGIQQL